MIRFLELMSSLKVINQNATLKTIADNNIRCGLFISKGNSRHFEAIMKRFNSMGISFNCVYMNSIGDCDEINYEEIVDVKYIHDNPLNLEYIIMYAEPYIWGIFEYFRNNGIKTICFTEPEVINNRIDAIYSHMPEIYSVYSRMDSKSQSVYLHTLKASVTCDIEDYAYAEEAQYFLEGYTPVLGDTVIDGGAFDGESAIDFLSFKANVISFELDKTNYQEAKEKADKYGFVAENYGLGDYEQKVRYTPADAGSCISSAGENIASIIDIDTYILRHDIPRIDYIKLDVEGSEMNALKGAIKTISKCQPTMAISAYHKFEDLWTIGNYIISIHNSYKFAFRHYKIDVRNYSLSEDGKKELSSYGVGMFIPTVYETVLYCKAVQN